MTIVDCYIITVYDIFNHNNFALRNPYIRNLP